MTEENAAAPALRERYRQTRPAFTLVEVLVVLGIIVILIAILIPIVNSVRERGRITVCQSNLHVIGQSLLMYVDAYKGHLPNGNPPNEWNDFDGQSMVLMAYAKQFVRSAGVFGCPSDPDGQPKSIDNADQLAANSVRTSYEFYSVWWAPEYGPLLVKMQGSTKRLANRGTTRDVAPLAWDADGADPKSPLRNHRGGGNVVYADGHVDWQIAKDWDQRGMPDPADEFWPIP